MPLLDERADRGALERGNPGDARALAQLRDGLAGDNAPIAHEHQLLDSKMLPQARDLRQQRLAVGDIALVHRHRYRATTGIGEQTVIDLQQALLAVAAVPEFRQRTAGALEVA